MVDAPLNPDTQYATEANLRARQRLWEQAESGFDLVGWVLELAAVQPGHLVLDVGCGNGSYLRRLAEIAATGIGADLSLGMLGSAPAGGLVNADAQHLPVDGSAVDVVLAPHMLYHVPDRRAAIEELRRVLRPGGVCVAVTNGAGHRRSVVDLVEDAVNRDGGDWQMPMPAVEAFSLENGRAQLAEAFSTVDVVQVPPRPPIRIRDASIVADYVASTADHYEPTIDLPWATVVERVRDAVTASIDRDGAFEVRADVGAIVCR